MSDRTFVDTNILVYAHDVDDRSKHDRARNALRALWNDGAAAIERAKRLKRARIDDEIASSIRASEAGDFSEYEAWESTLNDGRD